MCVMNKMNMYISELEIYMFYIWGCVSGGGVGVRKSRVGVIEGCERVEWV